MEINLKELETALGHDFANSELLIRALTHRSLAHELAQGNGNEETPVQQDNERLEFLGDAVLGLVVAEALFVSHPEWREGELTRVRSGLVSRQRMAQVATEIGLGKHLRLSRAEERSGLRRKSTDPFEYHGSSDGRALSRWWPGSRADLCAETSDGPD